MAQPSEYLDPNVIAAIQAEADKNGGNDYKCIVTLFYFGGMDTHNVLIPTGSNPNLPIYEALRDEGVRIEQDELTQTVLTDNSNLSVSADGTWALHPNLDYVHQLWESGDLAFIQDTGTLVIPTTKENYLQYKEDLNPEGIFSHKDQQTLWMSADVHKGFNETGWIGRTANFYDPYYNEREIDGMKPGPIFNPDQEVDGLAYTLSGSDIQSTSFPNMNSVNYKPVVYSQFHVRGEFNQSDGDAFDLTMRHGDGPPPSIPVQSNLILDSFVDIYNAAIESNEIANDGIFTWNDDDSLSQADKDRIEAIFNDATNDLSDYPDDASRFRGWISSAKNAAEIIYSSKSDGYNQRRQAIFLPFGGWDHHAQLRDNHDPKIAAVNQSVKALVEFLKDPSVDLYDNVAITHGADFSRTLSSNNTAGTDHAWASHAFVIGGPVKGGIYPTNYRSNYDPEGPKSDGSTLGRYIPEVSIDQYYCEILEWFGVPRRYAHLVLPKLGSFTTNNNSNYIFASGSNFSIDFI